MGMGWKKAAAQLGTGAVVSALRALEPQLKKRDYKRLVATTVAQLLQLYPGLGARRARRWTRRATGTRHPAVEKGRARHGEVRAEGDGGGGRGCRHHGRRDQAGREV